MFSHQRKSTSGVSIPPWLTIPGPVLFKRNVLVRFPKGRKNTVSIKHLAPLGNKDDSVKSENQSNPVDIPPCIPVDTLQIEVETQAPNTENTLNRDHQPPPSLRRSERQQNASED